MLRAITSLKSTRRLCEKSLIGSGLNSFNHEHSSLFCKSITRSVDSSAIDDLVSNTESHVRSRTPVYGRSESIPTYLGYFHVETGSISSLHDVHEGGIVDIDGDSLPEGFAGDAEEEFGFLKHSAWMIRDTTKILFRMIELHEEKFLNSDPKNKKIIKPIVQSPLHVSGYTDKPEWNNASARMYYFGSEVPAPDRLTKEKLHVLKGAGSTADEFTARLLEKSTNIPGKALLIGPRGVGKSYLLNQAVLYARQRGWICLFIPNGWEHAHGGSYIEPSLFGGDETLYDNQEMSVEALRHFWRAHGELMRKLPVTNKAAMEKYSTFVGDMKEAAGRVVGLKGRQSLNFIEIRNTIEDEDDLDSDVDEQDADVLEHFDILTAGFNSLEDLILFGVAFPDMSGSLFMDLVNELKALDSHLVLFAVDQINTWDTKSAFQYEYKEIQSRDLCVPRALSFLSPKKSSTENWSTPFGLCLAATSFKHGQGSNINYENAKSSIPVTIRVPAYNQCEYLAAMAYYTHLNAISDHDLNTLAAFRMFSQSVPGMMRRQLFDYFLPLECLRVEADFDKSSPTREDVLEQVRKDLAGDDHTDTQKDDWIQPHTSRFDEATIWSQQQQEVNVEELESLMARIKAEIKENN